MKVREGVVQVLRDFGVSELFGVVGDANLLFIADFIRDGDMRYTAVTHESNAVLMAAGLARSTATVGVATVTHGPGFANTLTSLTDSVRNRVPLLLITGSTPAHFGSYWQSFDIPGATRICGAEYVRVRGAGTVVDDVVRAFRIAIAGQTTVVLDLPADLEDEDIAPVDIAKVGHDGKGALGSVLVGAPGSTAFARNGGAAASVLDDAMGLILSLNRPLLLAGQGAVRSHAKDALIEFADSVGAVLATTIDAKGMFQGHPFDLGVMGSLAHSVAGDAIASADGVIAFGASLSSFTTMKGELLKGKRVVQIDSDLRAIGETVHVDVPVHGDAAEVARAMTAMVLEAAVNPSVGGRSERLKSALRDHSHTDDFTPISTATHEDPRLIFGALNEAIPRSRTVVSDTGLACVMSWRFFDAPEPRRFLRTWGFASIGLGLGTAVGAAVANPNEPTVLIVGDGAWAMSSGELATAIQLQLPLIVVHCNDGGYGAEFGRLVHHGFDPAVAKVDRVDPVPVARAMGAEAETIRVVADVKGLSDRLATLKRPLFLDLQIDPVFSEAYLAV